MSTSETSTRGVHVFVRSRYVPEHSRPDQGQWLFAYTVRIRNDSEDTVQLVTRHWVITDATGEEREVRGAGVVGVQPTLEPGQAFEYSSFCPLPTPVGSMHGSFQMVVQTAGDRFDAEVAPFTLSEPMAYN